MTKKTITVDKKIYDKFSYLCRAYGINPVKKRNAIFENWIMEHTEIGVFDRFEWLDFLDDNRKIIDKIINQEGISFIYLHSIDPIKNEAHRPIFEMSGESIYDYIIQEKG